MRFTRKNWMLVGMALLSAAGLALSHWLSTGCTRGLDLNAGTLLVNATAEVFSPSTYSRGTEVYPVSLVDTYARRPSEYAEFHLTLKDEVQQQSVDGKIDLPGGIEKLKVRQKVYGAFPPTSRCYFGLCIRSDMKFHLPYLLKGKRIIGQPNNDMQEYQWSIGSFRIIARRYDNLGALEHQFFSPTHGIAALLYNPLFLNKPGEVLADVDVSGESDGLLQNLFAVYQQPSTTHRHDYFFYALAALSLICVMVILWVWSLRKQVARKTKELIESEQKYRQLIDSATEGICVEIDDMMVYLNPQAIAILGLSNSPRYPLDARKFVYPEDYPLIQDKIRHSGGEGNEVGPMYHRIIQESGEVHWIKTNARRIVWDSKPALLSIFSDITEARSLEEAVKESEKRFRQLFEKSPVGLFYFNTDLVITLANDQLKKIFNYSEEDMDNFDLHKVDDKRIMPALSAVLDQREGTYRGPYQALKTSRDGDTYINLRTTPLFNEKNELQGGIGLIEDITEVKKSEHKLHSLEDRFYKAFHTSPDSLNINRLNDGLYLDINQGFIDLTGYSRKEVIGKTSLELDIWANSEDRARLVKELKNHGEVKNLEAEFRIKDGSIKTGLMSASLIEVDGETCIISITRDISDRKRVENLVRESEIRYRTMFQSVPVSVWEQDFKQVYDMLEDLRMSGITDLKRYLDSHPEFVETALKTIMVRDVNEVTVHMFEAQSKDELLGSIIQIFDREAVKNFEEELLAIWDHQRSFEGETINRTLDGKRMDVSVTINFPERGEDFSSVLVSLTDITQRKKAEAALRESESRYKSIFNSVPVSIWEEDFSKVNDLLNDLRENGIKDLDLYLRQHPQTVREAASMIVVNEVNDATVSMFGASSKVDLMQSIDKVFSQEAYDNFRRELIAIWNKQPSFYGETTNLTLDGREITISISTTIPQESEEYSRVFVSIEDITERKKAEDQIRRQVKHLASLRAVDMAISASIDLPITLRVLINQAVQQLSTDAASILLFNPHTQMLEYAAGSGFSTRAIEETRLKLGESYAGKAALERRMVTANDLGTQNTKLRVVDLRKEGFTDYLGVPLIAKGKVKGVLELFSHTSLPNTTEWMSLLDSMAGQAAIAIDNATLFDEVQQANISLRQAYDATIEGWARALELRDGETEGHSARVADMTIKLAQAFKMRGDALVDIRRGSLLHDIGKMGIPDHILLKKGPLTGEEWAIMRRHPDYAKNLLGSIDFLKGAIEIPYTHHEKWDGSGYPRGLKGEEIPLAGRVFAVIDCWDALRSDRPYRSAWTDAETWNHIQKNSGKDYDPKVVEKFRQLLISLGYLTESS